MIQIEHYKAIIVVTVMKDIMKLPIQEIVVLVILLVKLVFKVLVILALVIKIEKQVVMFVYV